MVLETYLKVDLRKYEKGGKVLFMKDKIYHLISLFLNDKKITKIKVPKKLESFPVNSKLLDSLR